MNGQLFQQINIYVIDMIPNYKLTFVEYISSINLLRTKNKCLAFHYIHCSSIRHQILKHLSMLIKLFHLPVSIIGNLWLQVLRFVKMTVNILQNSLK